MAKAARRLPADEVRYDSETVEFTYDAAGPIRLIELAASFQAIDQIYRRTTEGQERLVVTEIRSGSIVVAVAPYVMMMSDLMPALEAAVTLTKFTFRIKEALDAFSGILNSKVSDGPSVISREIAELVRPLTGKAGARLGIARIRYKSQTKDRLVEIEAEYGAVELDRTLINASRQPIVSEQALEAPQEDMPSLYRNVRMKFHQANSGPAKQKGQTGDRGVIEDIDPRSLPVYFADSIDRLKEKMVKGTHNPLLHSYIVDVTVAREKGEPKSYTVIEMEASENTFMASPMPLLESGQRKT